MKENIPKQKGERGEEGGDLKNKEIPQEEMSTNLWYGRIFYDIFHDIGDRYPEDEIVEQLKKETPALLSAIMERFCKYQCEHCLYPEVAKSTHQISMKSGFYDTLVSLAKQLPEKSLDGSQKPSFLHTGRMLTKKHLEVFENIKRERPDVDLGLIDSGWFVSLIDEFKKRGIQLDWIDVSLDGTRESHNKQRDPNGSDTSLIQIGTDEGGESDESAFGVAVEGLRRAREIIKPDGYVSSLFTLTSINKEDVAETADILLNPANPLAGGSAPLADKMVLTTMSPVRDSLREVEIDQDGFNTAWKQIVSARENWSDKFIVKIYRHPDMEKIARAAGLKTFFEAVNNAAITLDHVIFTIDGVEVEYTPLSTWPKEELHFDIDGSSRLAYGQKYTPEEYANADDTSDASRYTVARANKETNYEELYHKVVDQWWEEFGRGYLQEEANLFSRLWKELQEQEKTG